MSFTRATLFILTFSMATSMCVAQSNCLERTIPVSIYSKDGTSVPALAPSNLSGTYRDKRVVVKSILLESRLPRIVLLIDSSGSMKERIDVAIDAAEDVVSEVPPAAEIGPAAHSTWCLDEMREHFKKLATVYSEIYEQTSAE